MKWLSLVLAALVFNTLMIGECCAQESHPEWLNPGGMTVESRFVPPQGYVRKDYDDPYVDYMRKLPMLPDGSPVYLFNGALKPAQNHHVGVLDIDSTSFSRFTERDREGLEDLVRAIEELADFSRLK